MYINSHPFIKNWCAHSFLIVIWRCQCDLCHCNFKLKTAHRVHKLRVQTRVLTKSQYGNMVCNAPAARFCLSILKYNPPPIDSTQQKFIWCMCFTDPSDTAIKYSSLSCALSTSSVVVAIIPYFLWSGANVTNLMRSLIHAGLSANSCSNDSAGPFGSSSSIFSSAPSSLWIFSPYWWVDSNWNTMLYCSVFFGDINKCQLCTFICAFMYFLFCIFVGHSRIEVSILVLVW